MSDTSARTSPGFRGTQVRDDGSGPMLVTHRQRIAVIAGPDRGIEREVASPRVTLGTAAGNDIALTDPTVSRHHCEIVVREERYVIRDLGSTNGTRLDGTPVLEAYLSPGSRVQVGDTELLFEPKKKWVRVAAGDASDHFGSLYGSSEPMRTVFALLSKVGPTDLSCILVGETGTGKELAAHALHEASPRAPKAFVVVDAGAISETLIESELFGHERGAFTGADRPRAGAFELANGGTIFLDEIGELPLELQPKLLRALERREVKRLGAPKPIEVDVRVIAATHRDLTAMVSEGKFREDLYYRLAEVVVELPPLRQRVEDIPLITTRILAENAERGERVRAIDADAMRELQARAWPGNVRELRNTLRRAVALAHGETLTLADLSAPTGATVPRSSAVARPVDASAPSPQVDVAEDLPIKDAREKWVSSMEREYLVRLMQRCEGDLDRASTEAGLHRKSLERLLRQHGIKAAEMRGD